MKMKARLLNTVVALAAGCLIAIAGAVPSAHAQAASSKPDVSPPPVSNDNGTPTTIIDRHKGPTPGADEKRLDLTSPLATKSPKDQGQVVPVVVQQASPSSADAAEQTLEQERQAKLAQLAKDLAALQQLNDALAAQISVIQNALNDAESACKALLKALASAAEAAAATPAGPFASFVDSALGDVAKATGLDGGVCDDIGQLLQALIGLQEKLARANSALGQTQTQIAALQKEEDAAQAKARQERLRNGPKLRDDAGYKRVDPNSLLKKAGPRIGANEAPLSPCGGPKNPCHQKPSTVLGLGLLEGDTGFASQGPAAAGTAPTSRAPTGIPGKGP